MTNVRTGGPAGGPAGTDLPPLAALAVCDNGQDTPEPVQVGVCLVDAGCAAEPVTWLVRPAAPIAPVMTARVHGFGDADVAGAPGLAAVWPAVSDVVGGRLLVLHNAGRILRMLAGLPHPGLPDPGLPGVTGVTEVLDTLRLARRRRVSVGGSYALVPLLAAIRVDAGPVRRFQRADWTARATAGLFAHLAGMQPPIPFAVLATWCGAELPPTWTAPLTPASWPAVLREPSPPALPNPATGVQLRRSWS